MTRWIWFREPLFGECRGVIPTFETVSDLLQPVLQPVTMVRVIDLFKVLLQVVNPVGEFQQRLCGCRIRKGNRLLRFQVNPADKFGWDTPIDESNFLA